MRTLMLGLALIIRPVLADDLPTELAVPTHQLCGDSVAWLCRQAVTAEMVGQCVWEAYGSRVSRHAAQRPAFLTVIKTFFDAEVKKRRATLRVGNEVEQHADWFLHANATPESFSADLKRSVEEMDTLRDAFRQRKYVELADLKVTPTTPELSALVKDFETTKMRARLTDRTTFLYLGLNPIGRFFVHLHPATWQLLQAPWQRTGDPMRMLLLMAPGVHLPVRVSIPGHADIEPGFYFADDGNPPAVAGKLIHEMAHIVQDHLWDLKRLLEAFEKALNAQGSRLPNLDPYYPQRRFMFMHWTARPEYHKEVLALGDGKGLTKTQWMIFFSLLEYLREIDAHQREALMAVEQRMVVLPLQRDLQQHLAEAYLAPGKSVHPAAAAIFPFERARALVRDLNENLLAL